MNADDSAMTSVVAHSATASASACTATGRPQPAMDPMSRRHHRSRPSELRCTHQALQRGSNNSLGRVNGTSFDEPETLFELARGAYGHWERH